jgi:hypothetical protein
MKRQCSRMTGVIHTGLEKQKIIRFYIAGTIFKMKPAGTLGDEDKLISPDCSLFQFPWLTVFVFSAITDIGKYIIVIYVIPRIDNHNVSHSFLHTIIAHLKAKT